MISNRMFLHPKPTKPWTPVISIFIIKSYLLSYFSPMTAANLSMDMLLKFSSFSIK